MIDIYDWILSQEIMQCRRDEFYLCKSALLFGGDSSLQAYPFSCLGELKTDICRSYEQICRFKGNPAEYCPVTTGYAVEGYFVPCLEVNQQE